MYYCATYCLQVVPFPLGKVGSTQENTGNAVKCKQLGSNMTLLEQQVQQHHALN